MVLLFRDDRFPLASQKSDRALCPGRVTLDSKNKVRPVVDKCQDNEEPQYQRATRERA